MNGVGGLGRRLQEGGLYVLLFLLPFSKATVEIVFGVLLVGWVLERADPLTRWDSIWIRQEIRPIAWAVAGYLMICGLSVIWSSYPSLSLSGFVNKWLEYLCYMMIVAEMGARPIVVKRGIILLAFSSALVVVEGVAQEVLGHGIFLRHSTLMYARMSGPYTNPADLATFLMVMMPLFITFMMTLHKMKRILMFGLLLCLMVCFGRTMAVGPWLVFSLVVVMLLCLRRVTIRWHAIVLTIVAILSAGYFLQRTGNTHLVLRLDKAGTVDRVFMWQAAIRMIKDRPTLGHGLNTFMANYLKYWTGGERQPRYAHNCYLQVAAETGLIGLTTFLWLLWSILFMVVTGLRKALSISDDTIVLLGLFAGLLAFVVHSAVDTNFYSLRQAALFWVLAGLAIGLSQHVQSASSPVDSKSDKAFDPSSIRHSCELL